MAIKTKPCGFRSPAPHKRSSGNTSQFKLRLGRPNKYTPHQGAKERGER